MLNKEIRYIFFLIVLESLTFLALLKNPAVIFYMLYNNFISFTFCYILFFFVRKIFMDFTTKLTFFFFFFFEKTLVFYTSVLTLFTFFSSERFWYLSRASFRSLSLFFSDSIQQSFLYMWKKIFYWFFKTLKTI